MHAIRPQRASSSAYSPSRIWFQPQFTTEINEIAHNHDATTTDADKNEITTGFSITRIADSGASDECHILNVLSSNTQQQQQPPQSRNETRLSDNYYAKDEKAQLPWTLLQNATNDWPGPGHRPEARGLPRRILITHSQWLCIAKRPLLLHGVLTI